MSERGGDLSVTALYTSQTWAWAGLSYAPLLATPEAKRVFDVTNAALAAAGLFRRGQAPLRHELVHRHAMIDHLVGGATAPQVLELAAGLSRRGAAFSEDGRRRYTELDLPAMIARKRALLERTGAGRAVLARPNLTLAAADVEAEPLAAWVRPGEPLLVIAEGLLVYLAAAAQRRLWAKVAALADVAGAVRLVFDLTPAREQPAPGVAGRVLGAAMRRFTGGRDFERDDRGRADLVAELRAAGFATVDVIDSAAVARAWQLPHAEAATRQVLFDARR